MGLDLGKTSEIWSSSKSFQITFVVLFEHRLNTELHPIPKRTARFCQFFLKIQPMLENMVCREEAGEGSSRFLSNYLTGSRGIMKLGNNYKQTNKQKKVMQNLWKGANRWALTVFSNPVYVCVCFLGPGSCHYWKEVACVCAKTGFLSSHQPSLNPQGALSSDVVLLNRWSVRNYEVQRGDIVSVVWVTGI